MVSTTSPRKSQAPWTVITQGSDVSFEDQTLLDNLEYVLRVGGPATARFLGESGNVTGLTRAISRSIPTLASSVVKLRAGKLLNATIDFAVNSEGESLFKDVFTGLETGLFGSLLKLAEDPERAVAAAYLQAIGAALGARTLASLAEDAGLTEALDIQKARYVTAVCAVLSSVPTAPAGEPATAPAPSLPAGLIPTVAGISPHLAAAAPTSEADAELSGVLLGLAAFLSRDGNRVAFCGAAGAKAVSVLAGLLAKDGGLPVQSYYQAAFCLWLLSFSGPKTAGGGAVAAAMGAAGVPRRLTAVLRESSAEKVIRVSLATLRNLMAMGDALRKDMVAAGLVGALESLCLLQWKDEDIRDDLGVLADALESEHASMSTFDVYRAEVLSGALEWSPAHRDEAFWQENVEKLENNNLEVLRCIVRILNESEDNTVLSVACHDLAQFVRHHPRGRQIAQSFAVKGRLMELMATGEGEVRRYALNGVQVLMITHWNLMQRSV